MNSEPNPHAELNLKQKTYLDLKQRLISCTYPPGSILNEKALATEFGVSRTPIREALSQLEKDGYLQILPKKGIYVTDISLEKVVQIFQTRLEIEPITLRMSAPYLDLEDLIRFRYRLENREEDLDKSLLLDTEMHLFLIDHCRNDYLISMMHRLFDDNTRVVIATGQTEAKIHNAVAEHLEILDSLITHQDTTVSAQLLRKHIETCRTEALRYFSSGQYRNYTVSGSVRIPGIPAK